MKTISDLNVLIPTLVDLLCSQDHNIGESYMDCDEDGACYCTEAEGNTFYYEEDGWYIEVSYECSGEWVYERGDYWTPSVSYLTEARGEVTEIICNHYDDETGDETDFTDEDLNELWKALDKALEHI